MAVQYFDSVQPHGLRVWDQPATGTSVVHQKQKRRKRGRKREAIINHITMLYIDLLTYHQPYCLGIVT